MAEFEKTYPQTAGKMKQHFRSDFVPWKNRQLEREKASYIKGDKLGWK